MMTMEGNKTSQTGTLRMILQWTGVGMKSPQILQVRNTHLTPGGLLRRLGLAFWMQALVALAHRPAGLALRENVLNLGFAAREIAVGW